MGSDFFELENATVQLGGKSVLTELSLRIGSAERVCLLGPSGAGKTTLLRVLGGSQRQHDGRVRVGGIEFSKASAEDLRKVRARIGFVHQDHGLVPNLRVSQNVLAGRLGTRGWWASLRSILHSSSSDLEEAHALLESVGIGDKLFVRADRLSGGEAQRVALARALFQDPEALLADEPVASVDPARARVILRLLLDCAETRSLPLVTSLHDPVLAREFFERVIGLRAGRIVFDQPASEVDDEALAALYDLDGVGSE